MHGRVADMKYRLLGWLVSYAVLFVGICTWARGENSNNFLLTTAGVSIELVAFLGIGSLVATDITKD
jgi:hypothetical protein